MTTVRSPKLSCEECPSRLLGVLCAIEDPALEDLNRRKTTNMYKKGQVIFYEGNDAYGIYCIYAGRVKLFKSAISGRQQIVRVAGPGDLIGYRAIFAEEPYAATAEALEDATICCIDKNAFFSVMSDNPKLALTVIRKLAKELRIAEDMATSIAQKSVRERMAELILMLKETYGRPSKKGVTIDLHLSREEMAEMIGITQETAIRLLSEFKQDGLIEVKEREITVLNPKALVEVANLEI